MWAAEGCYTWEVPTLVSLLCAILPKNGAPYVSTNPEYFDRPWLGAEIKAKVSLLVKFKKPGKLLCSKMSKYIFPGLGRIIAHGLGSGEAG